MKVSDYGCSTVYAHIVCTNCHIKLCIVYTVFLLFLNRVEISQRVLHQSYSLILGINMTAALFLQTILTLVVTDKVGLALSSRDQVSV